MKELALLVAGFVLWSIAFILIYAAQATGCAIGLQTNFLRAILIAVLAAFLLAGGAVLAVAARRRESPLGRSAVLASVAALIASALTFSGIFWADLC